MWYALAKRQDYFAERVHRFVPLASCIIPYMYAGLTSYDEIVSFFLTADAKGIYNLFGDDESSDTFWGLACDLIGGLWCLVPEELPDWSFTQVYANSASAFFYYAQVFLEQRFQEPQSLEKYARGDRVTPLVPLENIDRVPVTIIHGASDSRCPIHMAEWVY